MIDGAEHLGRVVVRVTLGQNEQVGQQVLVNPTTCGSDNLVVRLRSRSCLSIGGQIRLVAECNQGGDH